MGGCAGTRASSGLGDGVLPEATEASGKGMRATGAPLPFALRPAHVEPELVAMRHTVAPGETMYRIAKTYGLTVEELSKANGISDARAISVGQELTIPGTESGPVEMESSGHVDSDEEPELVLSSPGTAPVSSPRRARPPVARREDPPPARGRVLSGRPGSASARPRVATQGLLDWPLKGVLYGRFGKKGKEPHDGVDLAAPAGTPVKTAQEGTVLYAGEQKGYGLIAIVEHSAQLITLYAHNRDLRVRTGQKVRRGQVIATVGESGKTSGPHLHFEVRVDGKPVEPLDYLGPMPPS
ncbi:M23 family metallopeptidase [Corallococcus sp. M34]|uniref:peptidoglycan DD-metalloendopeptidase family protein n=1 Tax=Citreicoccus inhibens TaxID=2849499 RepID=UPI001C21C388|nr:M23 family metallopeptidase [Citreicoccus inhibens]MBU8897854.1 M23 family metallopeptidase [Citreicoccus inhibens]